MSYRAWPANFLISMGRTVGRALGCELAVEQSSHSIKTEMEVPDKDKRAWDRSMFKYGNLFIDGYANPVKIRVKQNEGLENPDTVTVEESEQTATDGGENETKEDSGPHVQMISSTRYRRYMIQDLVSQLLTPEEQWKKIMYVVLALAVLMMANVFISLSAAGIL